MNVASVVLNCSAMGKHAGQSACSACEMLASLSLLASLMLCRQTRTSKVPA